MSNRQFAFVILLIFVAGSLAVGLAMWEHSVSMRFIKVTNPSIVTVEQDRDDNPKPTFKTKDDRLTAKMDLTYCWFATFTNETTGLSHTLHNAYDKSGEPCH